MTGEEISRHLTRCAVLGIVGIVLFIGKPSVFQSVRTIAENYSRDDTARCDLLFVAYIEQDELAPGWYDAAAVEMKQCGIDVDHTDGERGSL